MTAMPVLPLLLLLVRTNATAASTSGIRTVSLRSTYFAKLGQPRYWWKGVLPYHLNGAVHSSRQRKDLRLRHNTTPLRNSATKPQNKQNIEAHGR